MLMTIAGAILAIVSTPPLFCAVREAIHGSLLKAAGICLLSFAGLAAGSALFVFSLV